MQPLTFYAGRQPHFADHLYPIYAALPTEYRGQFYALGRASRHLTEQGVEYTEAVPRHVLPNDQVVVVASYEDLRAVKPRPVVMVNHGIGQTYMGDPHNLQAMNHPSYTGGRGREAVILNLCPSERDAVRCRNAGQEAAAVGPCKMDRWLNTPATPEPGLIAFSFHADIHAVPETRWSLPHYESAIRDIVASAEFPVIGHGHPRMHSFLGPWWKSMKVEFVPNFSDVLDRASIYVCDNSSSMYEFAATRRSVVVLDAPWYRKDVEHGLRFWSEADVGVRVGEPGQLDSALRLALTDPPLVAKRREHTVNRVYANAQGRSLCDGRATERAVKALTELADRLG